MLSNNKDKYALWSELKSDLEWLYSRDGLWKKYHKQLKSKYVRDNTVLGWSKYTTPSKNTAHMCIIKNTYGGVPTLEYVILFEYNGGYLEPISKNGKVSFFIHYTAHSIARVKERMGVSFLTAFEKQCLKSDVSAQDYSSYGYSGTESLMWFGGGFFICNMNDNGFLVAITYVDGTQAYSNQLKTMLVSKTNADREFSASYDSQEARAKQLPRSFRRHIWQGNYV